MYTWDVGGNESNFFVRDQTGIIPFKILPGAPLDSLVVKANGEVAVTSITGDGAGLTNVTASNTSDVVCAECVGSTDIENGTIQGEDLDLQSVGFRELSAITAYIVECDGECDDGDLGEVCDSGPAHLPLSRPLAVSCTKPSDSLTLGVDNCGGDNDCTSFLTLNIADPLGQYCADVDGRDAIVYCLHEPF